MLHRMKPDQWVAVINTNLVPLFNMCRHVIEGMRGRKSGRIVNISSSQRVRRARWARPTTPPPRPARSASPRALAQESARSGITVNAIAPGYIDTDMVQAVPKDVLEKSSCRSSRLGRLGEPEEIARCVVFLASDDAGFITGSTLSANGGQYFAGGGGGGGQPDRQRRISTHSAVEVLD